MGTWCELDVNNVFRPENTGWRGTGIPFTGCTLCDSSGIIPKIRRRVKRSRFSIAGFSKVEKVKKSPKNIRLTLLLSAPFQRFGSGKQKAPRQFSHEIIFAEAREFLSRKGILETVFAAKFSSWLFVSNLLNASLQETHFRRFHAPTPSKKSYR